MSGRTSILMKISQAYESYLDHIETLNKMIPSLVPLIFWAKTGGRHLIVSGGSRRGARGGSSPPKNP